MMLREIVYSIFDGLIIGAVALVFIKIGVKQAVKKLDDKDGERSKK